MSHDAIRGLVGTALEAYIPVKLVDLMALIEERDALSERFAQVGAGARVIFEGLGKIGQMLSDREDADGSISGGADPLTDAEQEAFGNMALPLEDMDIRCSFGKQCHLRSVAEREESGDETQTKPSPCEDPPAGPGSGQGTVESGKPVNESFGADAVDSLRLSVLADDLRKTFGPSSSPGGFGEISTRPSGDDVDDGEEFLKVRPFPVSDATHLGTPSTEPIQAPAFVRQNNFTEGAVNRATTVSGNVSPWRASYTPNQCQLALRLLALGKNRIEIAGEVGVSYSAVHDIAKLYKNQLAVLSGEKDEAKREKFLDSIYRQMIARWEAAGKDRAVQPDNVPYKPQGKGSTDTTSVTKNMGHDSDHRKLLSPEARKALEEKGL